MWVGGQSDLFSQKRFGERIRSLSILFVILYSGITLRLFFLQVIKGDALAQISESNRTQVLFLRAPRGDIYDHKGRVIVTNRPSWSLMFSGPEDLKDKSGEVEKRLAPFLEPFPKRWISRLHYSFKSGQMVRLAEDVPDHISFGLRELGELLPGLRVVMEFRRGYPHGFLAGHLVGYLAEIDEKELREEYWQPRKLGDLIGKRGLEKILDSTLRGRDGGMLIEVDSVGKLKKVLRELPSTKGSSIQLTLDVDVQRAAEEALGKTSTTRGAAVVMDIHNGAVLAWASSPSFDPDGDLQAALIDSNKPFFDRVLKGFYAPGSPFKIITALAGFANSAIRIKDEIECQGFVALKDRKGNERVYKCWSTHGKVDFWKGLAESCDAYYYLLGSKMGAEPIYQMAREFGLGQETQKFLPGETRGIVPNPAWKRRQGLGGWSTGDTFNMAIGQGFLTTTPLQLTVMTAGVANKGTIYHPYVIQKILDPQGKITFENQSSPWKQVVLDDSIWAAIHESLRRVVKFGTGRTASIPYLDVRGKTGTAQNPHGKDHAWFVAYAGYPGEEPRLAVCVFVENGGGGSVIAAPIAKQILEIALPPRTGDVSV